VCLVCGDRSKWFGGQGRRIPGRWAGMVAGCRGGRVGNSSHHRSYGAWLWPSWLSWSMGGGSEICVDSEFTDSSASSLGKAKFDLAAAPGYRPRIWHDVRGLRWSTARATRRLGRAASQLSCARLLGPCGVSLGGSPEYGGVCLFRLVSALCRRRVTSHVWFSLDFPHKLAMYSLYDFQT
jgi:hypothetical protein